MAKRHRSRRPRRAVGIARPLKTSMVLAVPLVTGTAAVAVAVSELAPAPASASTTPNPGGVLSSLLPLPSPSPKLTPKPLPTLPIHLPLPGQSPAPAQSPAPQPRGTSPASPSSGSAPSSSRHAAHHSSKAAPSHPQPQPAPLPMPWASSATPTTAPLSQQHAVGYALPVPASLVTAHPALIGEGTPAPHTAQAARAVTLGVPQGTPVNAVTAGTLKVIRGAGGMSTIVLSGTDGATYTYKNVTPVPQGAGNAKAATTKAGEKIGTSGPGGLPFSISVPDVRGPVDANEAMQAWASGLTVNVRSLPATIAPATAPTRQQVLVVTDSGARAVGAALSKSLAGPLVQVRTATLGRKNPLARQVAAPGGKQLVIVALAHGTPAQAAALAGRLHGARQVLWVAPAGTTARQAAAYRSLAASHPGFRVESLPAALVPPKAAKAPSVNPALQSLSALPGSMPANAASAAAAQTSAGELAVGTLTAAYATTAYRLYSISSQADTVLSWAELEMGKPYKWGAAGPDAFDCSGLTMDALNQAGIAVPHNANNQWMQTKSHPVAVDKLAPGDLVFFAGSDGTPAAPGHVGIYVGDGEILDAPHTGAPVRFDPLSSLGGYTGATNPYAPSLAGGSALAGAQLAGLAVPSALSQYQTFAQQLSASAWGPSQFPYLYQLWQRESGWDPAALNPLSGAFGIPQSLPAGKMASAGMDWQTDPYTQIIWGIGYIRSAYGDPQAAWAHEVAYGWY